MSKSGDSKEAENHRNSTRRGLCIQAADGLCLISERSPYTPYMIIKGKYYRETFHILRQSRYKAAVAFDQRSRNPREPYKQRPGHSGRRRSVFWIHVRKVVSLLFCLKEITAGERFSSTKGQNDAKEAVRTCRR